MKSNLSAAAFLLILAVCFTLGLISALAGRASVGQPAQTSTAAQDGQDQTAILIVGVDDLQAERPSLLAVWVATYRLPGRELFLLGLPADLTATSASDGSLSELFRFSPVNGLAAEFSRAVFEHVPLTPDLVVVLDRTAFTAVVDYLGGLDLNGAHLDGIEVIAVLDMLAGDAQASLATQARVLEAMTLRAPPLGDSPDITSLLQLVPTHAYLSDSVGLAVGLASPLLPIEPPMVHFDVLETGSGMQTPVE
ncbi:MAG: hypothetical protein AB1449_02230 [Chloroflexota bacterium]